MGDFVGGMLKYLRRHPVPRVTVAGGVAKITKLAQGLLDLHSKQGAVDLATLAQLAQSAGATTALCERIVAANTAAEAFALAEADNVALGEVVASAAKTAAARVVEGQDIAIEVVIFDRDGRLMGRSPFACAHDPPPRNLRRYSGS
jgi:cobalt-precorrin-5B (C1)-methyltransferase